MYDALLCFVLFLLLLTAYCLSFMGEKENPQTIFYYSAVLHFNFRVLATYAYKIGIYWSSAFISSPGNSKGQLTAFYAKCSESVPGERAD